MIDRTKKSLLNERGSRGSKGNSPSPRKSITVERRRSRKQPGWAVRSCLKIRRLRSFCYNFGMACPERRVVLAGESPVRENAGVPGSRLQSGGEIRPSRAECQKPFKKEGEQTSGPQQSVNAIASTNYQPKGVWESRAAHVTVKATDSISGPERMLELPGVSGGGTLGQNNAEQERPYLAA